MTKDVLLSISGLHQDVTGIEAQGDEPGNEPIEVIAPANYYEKNGKHYVIYDELVEGIPGTIKNKVRIMDDRKVEIIKSGITNTHMVFELQILSVDFPVQTTGSLLLCLHSRSHTSIFFLRNRPDFPFLP